MKTILVAIDLEQDAGSLLARASQLALRHEAAIVVQTVMDISGAETCVHSEAMERHAREELKAAIGATDLGSAPSLRVECGVPHRAITRAARDLSADVILIGPGRPTTTMERVFGSTADRIVRTSAVPVLVVRGEAPRPYNRVAVAIDFSPHSATALSATRRLAPDAPTELVHVLEIPLGFEQAMLRVGTPSGEIERFRRSRTGEARRRLLAFGRQHAPEARVSVLSGAPAAMLVDLSHGGRVDLLAFGTQGRNAVAQALLGSVARRLLAEAGCDVLVVGGEGA